MRDGDALFDQYSCDVYQQVGTHQDAHKQPQLVDLESTERRRSVGQSDVSGVLPSL